MLSTATADAKVNTGSFGNRFRACDKWPWANSSSTPGLPDLRPFDDPRRNIQSCAPLRSAIDAWYHSRSPGWGGPGVSDNSPQAQAISR